jgi:hypothetical protein
MEGEWKKGRRGEKEKGRKAYKDTGEGSESTVGNARESGNEEEHPVSARKSGQDLPARSRKNDEMRTKSSGQ